MPSLAPLLAAKEPRRPAEAYGYSEWGKEARREGSLLELLDIRALLDSFHLPPGVGVPHHEVLSILLGLMLVAMMAFSLFVVVGIVLHDLPKDPRRAEAEKALGRKLTRSEVRAFFREKEAAEEAARREREAKAQRARESQLWKNAVIRTSNSLLRPSLLFLYPSLLLAEQVISAWSSYTHEEQEKIHKLVAVDLAKTAALSRESTPLRTLSLLGEVAPRIFPQGEAHRSLKAQEALIRRELKILKGAPARRASHKRSVHTEYLEAKYGPLQKNPLDL